MTREELENSLEQVLENWENKTKEEVEALAGPLLAETVGYDQQTPHHCYDLYRHILHTVDALPDQAPVLLKTAAFFHDIGKPAVAAVRKGRMTFYDHAQKSAELADEPLTALGYSEAERKEIEFYIGHHDDFISWVLPYEEYDHANPWKIPITAENLRKHIEKAAEADPFYRNAALWNNLMLLCYADFSAQAEQIVISGVTVDSREHKHEKAGLLIKACREVFQKEG